MKYQIYLNKEASEIINTMAEAINTKPTHLLKILFENMAVTMQPTLEVLINELTEAAENTVKHEIR